ncbi:hypothetical protein SAMN05216226_11613 [Halovenus aranensis]|uniref:Uncharacterized protein n=1 Tax=Halovenus aranensis TaxID=890420 RepID=A0A1G8YSN8_9EURY|nr:hypothetical protein [Halovenus aranensis]SDK05801.1 hypothetical protein SAMN05216226_11613 [Halovenus aranensis]
MTHLSSCYFCGDGLETPVQTYELADGTTTVSLCRTCREKLETVIAAAGAVPPTPATAPETGSAAEDDVSGSDNPTEQANGKETETDETPFEDDLSSLDEETPGGNETPSGAETTIEEETVVAETTVEETVDETEDTAEAVSAQATEPVGTDDAVDGVEEQSAGSEPGTADGDEMFDFEDSSDDALAEETLEPELDNGADLDDPLEGEELFAEEESLKEEADDSLGTEMGDDSPEDNPTAAETGEVTDDDPLAGDSVETDNEPASDDTADGPTDSPAPRESAETPPEESTDSQPGTGEPASETGKNGGNRAGKEHDTPAETTISALEYNRVMRMLQNRNFPVDRTEIEVVAANAYDLAESECAQVIDLAVDRGLLEERDGELYRPDD